MPATPFFSIVTPTYQCGRFVERVAWAISQQTCDDWEWVVVDDGSSDETAEVLRSVERTMGRRLRVVRFGKNRGRGAARAAGAEAAVGRNIVWWDMDDLAPPHRLERLGEALDPDIDYVASHAAIIDESLEVSGVRAFRNDPLLGKVFLGPTAAVRADVVRRVGFDATSTVGEDKRLVYALSRSGNGAYLDEILYLYFEGRAASPAKAEADCRNEIGLMRGWARGGSVADRRHWIARVRRLQVKRVALGMMRLAPACYRIAVRLRDRREFDRSSDKTLTEFLELARGQPWRQEPVEVGT